MTTTVLERPDVGIEDRIEGSAASSNGLTDTPTDEGVRIATVERGGGHGRSDGAGWRELPRRIFYTTWRLLPGWAQGLAFRMGAPKVSMGAVAVIRDGRGRILLAHHTYRQRAWGLPGGLVGRREQAAEAVARELREELGVAAVVGPLLCAETCVPSRHLTLYYLATIDSQPQLDGVEIDGFRYVALDEAGVLLGEEARAWLASLRHMAYPHTWAS
ncbi:MAG TPA: NUDIX hydrolase [Ktedonobacterales bacterium]